MSVSTVALLLVGGGLLLYGVILFNRFVKLNALADEAWSGIDVQLKRRHDLVPALVETVKGYAKHEQETLEEVTSLRNTLRDEKNILQREGGEKTLSRDIGKLFALAEAYPDLKADQNFRKLQSDLTSVEDDLQYARRY
ncbi:MAG: LemA family protein, partial [Bdellovibrionales bacterium]|nr:LemA family protein [Bdellovibrionales bacterium]